MLAFQVVLTLLCKGNSCPKAKSNMSQIIRNTLDNTRGVKCKTNKNGFNDTKKI